MRIAISFLLASAMRLCCYAQEAPTNYPVLSVWPPHLDFGRVVMGDSVTNAFTVKNVGGGRAHGSVGLESYPGAPYDPDTFRVLDSSFDLGPGESHRVRVAYTPSGASVDMKSANFGGWGGVILIAGLRGTRLGTYAPPAPVISVSPTNLDFGILAPGEARTNYITIRNTGTARLEGAAAVSTLIAPEYRPAHGTYPGGIVPFELASGREYSLGTNESQVLTIIYRARKPLPKVQGNVSFSISGRFGKPLATLYGACRTP